MKIDQMRCSSAVRVSPIELAPRQVFGTGWHTPALQQHLATRCPPVQVRMGAGTMPAVQRHVMKQPPVRVYVGNGSMPAVQRHIARAGG